jgi:hypothetical protein
MWRIQRVRCCLKKELQISFKKGTRTMLRRVHPTLIGFMSLMSCRRRRRRRRRSRSLVESILHAIQNHQCARIDFKPPPEPFVACALVQTPRCVVQCLPSRALHYVFV